MHLVKLLNKRVSRRAKLLRLQLKLRFYRPQPFVSWISGISDKHPWKDLYTNRTTFGNSVIASTNELIWLIERANPRNLDDKKKAFRNDPSIKNVLSLRLEFLVMATLLRHGLDAHFMGPKQPDIEVKFEGEVFNLEITRRANSDVENLHDDLEKLLEGTNYSATIFFDQRPITMSSSLRSECLNKVSNFLNDKPKGRFTLSFNSPELPVFRVELLDQMPELLSRVTIEDNALLSPAFDSVEKLVISKLMHKSEQAKGWTPGALLVMDITGIARSWFRTPQMWAERSTAWKIPWEKTNFSVLVITFTDLTNCELGFFCLFDPSLTTSQYEAYARLIQNLRTDNLIL